MRSEGSGFSLGLCSPKVVSFSQLSATVCVRGFPQRRVRPEWSRKRVKLSRDAAITMAFSEKVSV